MVLSTDDVVKLWEKYQLPREKRVHCYWVAVLASWFAGELSRKCPDISIDRHLVFIAALLHDLDKAVQKLPGEHHPDAAVRILRVEGLSFIADIVRTHPLHSILDQTIAPKTWEEKVVYLADKMTKEKIITVDERFRRWQEENLPPEAKDQLSRCYPLVKNLEHEVCSLLHVDPTDIARLAASDQHDTMGLL